MRLKIQVFRIPITHCQLNLKINRQVNRKSADTHVMRKRKVSVIKNFTMINQQSKMLQLYTKTKNFDILSIINKLDITKLEIEIVNEIAKFRATCRISKGKTKTEFNFDQEHIRLVLNKDEINEIVFNCKFSSLKLVKILLQCIAKTTHKITIMFQKDNKKYTQSYIKELGSLFEENYYKKNNFIEELYIWSQGEHLYQGMETSFSLNEMFDCMKEIKANDIKLFGLYIDSDLFFALIEKFSSKSLVFDKCAFKENHEIKGDVINTLPKISFINCCFNASYSIENKRNKPLRFDRYKRLVATRNCDIFFNKFLRKIKRESDLENIEIIYSFGLKEFLVTNENFYQVCKGEYGNSGKIEIKDKCKYCEKLNYNLQVRLISIETENHEYPLTPRDFEDEYLSDDEERNEN